MAEDNKLKLNKEQLDKVAGGSHGGFFVDPLRNTRCSKGDYCNFVLVWTKVDNITGEKLEQLYSCTKCNCELVKDKRGNCTIKR